MDPTTFEAWMQILQRVPNSVFWFLRYAVVPFTELRNHANSNLIFRVFEMQK
jgi:predicted O-linked N-acetylglucosamine transferase (SPINDLY family)